MTVVYKGGVWDLLHAGHLNIIRIAKNLGAFLVVGVATDEHVLRYKGHAPTMRFHDRLQVMAELRSVDAVVPYDGPCDLTPIELFGVSIHVVDQFYGVGDGVHPSEQRRAKELWEERGVRFVVVPRTPGISSTRIKERINEEG